MLLINGVIKDEILNIITAVIIITSNITLKLIELSLRSTIK